MAEKASLTALRPDVAFVLLAFRSLGPSSRQLDRRNDGVVNSIAEAEGAQDDPKIDKCEPQRDTVEKGELETCRYECGGCQRADRSAEPVRGVKKAEFLIRYTNSLDSEFLMVDCSW